MPGGLEAKLARRRAIEDPGFQDAVLDQCTALAGDAFGIERMRTKAALAQRIIDNVDTRAEDLLPELVLQKAGTARDRCPVDRGCEMSDERTSDSRLEHHRYFSGRDLSRVEPAGRTFAGRAADRIGLLKIGGVDC